MMNMEEWPSIYSNYMEEGGKIPGYRLESVHPDPQWSPVPPVDPAMYWVFDKETRIIAPLHLYRTEFDEADDALTINVFALPGMNPDCDAMTGKVLYGPVCSLG